MKIIFFGTPKYVLPIIEALHKSFKSPKIESGVMAVVTQPPKPTGRKQKLEYSPVDTWAYKKNIPIFHKAGDLIKSDIKADLGVLASYGEIIPKYVISHLSSKGGSAYGGKFGILNIHPSLLPKWRGASPIQASIINGDETTGVTIIKLDEKLDHGPIISQFKEKILDTDTTESLRKRLFERSANVIASLLPAYLKGKIKSREQQHLKATFTTQVKKDDAFIPPEYISANLQGETLQTRWEIPFMNTKYSQASLSPKGKALLIKNYSLNPTPYTLERFIRAMQPWPGAWTYVQLSSKLKAKSEKRLKILKAHLEESQITSHKSPVTKLVLDEVQLEGKNSVSWKQFKEAYPEAEF